MKNGHALDHRVGEIHNHINSAAVRDIHCIQPERIGDGFVVFSKTQEKWT